MVTSVKKRKTSSELRRLNEGKTYIYRGVEYSERNVSKRTGDLKSGSPVKVVLEDPKTGKITKKAGKYESSGDYIHLVYIDSLDGFKKVIFRPPAHSNGSKVQILTERGAVSGKLMVWLE
jgi:uncharacterized protein YwbE